MTEHTSLYSNLPGRPRVDLLADWRDAQETGHHVDCDGWRTSCRASIVITEAALYAAECEECGWQTTGSFSRREVAQQFVDEHSSGEVTCDLRCQEWPPR